MSDTRYAVRGTHKETGVIAWLCTRGTTSSWHLRESWSERELADSAKCDARDFLPKYRWRLVKVTRRVNTKLHCDFPECVTSTPTRRRTDMAAKKKTAKKTKTARVAAPKMAKANAPKAKAKPAKRRAATRKTNNEG